MLRQPIAKRHVQRGGGPGARATAGVAPKIEGRTIAGKDGRILFEIDDSQPRRGPLWATAGSRTLAQVGFPRPFLAVFFSLRLREKKVPCYQESERGQRGQDQHPREGAKRFHGEPDYSNREYTRVAHAFSRLLRCS